jgi:hypothetical protein
MWLDRAYGHGLTCAAIRDVRVPRDRPSGVPPFLYKPMQRAVSCGCTHHATCIKLPDPSAVVHILAWHGMADANVILPRLLSAPKENLSEWHVES